MENRTAIQICKNAFSEDVLKIVQQMSTAGFEAFIVGGAVRDCLLGIDVVDIDMTTNAVPSEIEKLFPQAIPTGKAFGTMTIPNNNQENSKGVEMTTYRSDGTYSNQRHPDEIKFETDICKDLARRDFTINAFAYNPVTQEFKDEFNGLVHLTERKLEVVGDPEKRFTEDSLRLFRGCRFVSQLNFCLSEKAEEAFVRCAKKGMLPAKERILVEMTKLINAANPSTGLLLLQKSGLGERYIDGFNEIKLDQFEKIDRAPMHHRWAHLLSSLEFKKVMDTCRLPKKTQKQIEKLIQHDFNDEKVAFTVNDLEISSQDIQNFGFKGPEIGKIQRFIYKKVIQDLSLNTQFFCYELLKEYQHEQNKKK